jgi:acetamidase/formamidase
VAREVPPDRVHYLWDEGNEPTLSVHSGEEIFVQTREVSDGQLTRESTSDSLASLDEGRLYPLAGPVHVEGAEPGDVLAVEMLELEPQGWGWSAILPGLGLLPEEFNEPYLRIFELDGGATTSLAGAAQVPVEPFFGTLGVCPAGARAQSVMPPGVFGGNMDTRQLVRGSTLYLPVHVPGALFSCGDAHAGQGDGEVCVTGIETPMHATLRLTVQKGRSIPAPQFETPGPLTPSVGSSRFYGTTGVGPDLYRASQDAVRAMVDHISSTYGLSREDAYVLASLCVDLKISEIVDAGQYIVSALLPLAVFD